jgi:hypothetical protein
MKRKRKTSRLRSKTQVPSCHYAARNRGIMPLATRVVILDRGPKGRDPEAWQRAEKLDFSTSEVPLPHCKLCDQPYQDFRLPPHVWALLPDNYQRVPLCRDDFLRVLREAGHDTSGIEFSDDAWKVKQDLWRQTAQAPKNRTQVRIQLRKDMPGEIMWCEVLDNMGNGNFIVRLRNTSFIDARLCEGSVIQARWNGSCRHGVSGRPLFEPVRHLPVAGKPLVCFDANLTLSKCA